MKIDQFVFHNATQEKLIKNDIINKELANIVFVFGMREKLEIDSWLSVLKEKYSNADIVSCSASEIINNNEVQYNTISYTAIQFEATEIVFSTAKIGVNDSSFEAGRMLVGKLSKQGLRNILVLSDGQKVNGSELVKGINSLKPEGTIVTGGLAGDGDRFHKTLVGINELPKAGNIVAIGFYGEALSIGFGSRGGWDSFGSKRLVTKSESNVLYELDDQSALSLYKKYLGEKASGLPGTALLFPLALHIEGIDQVLVRTVLNVDEKNGTMTFAGDIPEGAYVQLMKANFDRLIDGSSDAAQSGLSTIKSEKVELALLISCIGRKLVLGQRIEEEVESVREIFGDETAITGFYSYGEISPLTENVNCQLHNQTMTITTFSENI